MTQSKIFKTVHPDTDQEPITLTDKEVIVAVAFVSRIEKEADNLFNYRAGEFDLTVAIGDIVLVHTRYGVALARVEEVYYGYSGIKGGPIISIVTDASPHLQKLKSKLREASIRKELEARIKNVKIEEIYEQYAAQDETIAQLVEEQKLLDERLEKYKKMTG